MRILNADFDTDNLTVLQSNAKTPEDLDVLQSGLGRACVAVVADLQARKLRPAKIVYKGGAVTAYGKASATSALVASAVQAVVG